MTKQITVLIPLLGPGNSREGNSGWDLVSVTIRDGGNMELKIRQLVRRLLLLGYCQFEIKNIVKEAIGSDNLDSLSFAHANQIMTHLALYEKLGMDYINNYSK